MTHACIFNMINACDVIFEKPHSRLPRPLLQLFLQSAQLAPHTFVKQSMLLLIRVIPS